MAALPGGSESRFPGFDVLDEAGAWDEVTRETVLARCGPLGSLRFFSSIEEPTARALVDLLMGQGEPPRVPVLELIDQRLATGQGDGYRYSDLPEDPAAWRSSLANLDDEAADRHGRPFAALEREDQAALLEAIRELDGSWRGLPAKRIFGLWVRYACSAFYSHPLAWNEIGFPGPAYPRGYANLGLGRREHFEVEERDASDPVPWTARAEAARARHRADLGQGGNSTAGSR